VRAASNAGAQGAAPATGPGRERCVDAGQGYLRLGLERAGQRQRPPPHQRSGGRHGGRWWSGGRWRAGRKPLGAGASSQADAGMTQRADINGPEGCHSAEVGNGVEGGGGSVLKSTKIV
jgi:hypothetical protein